MAILLGKCPFAFLSFILFFFIFHFWNLKFKKVLEFEEPLAVPMKVSLQLKQCHCI